MWGRLHNQTPNTQTLTRFIATGNEYWVSLCVDQSICNYMLVSVRNRYSFSNISIRFVVKSYSLNLLIPTLEPQSNGPLYSNMVIGTLAVDGWAVTFGIARRGLGELWPCPVPSSLYQM